MLNHMIQETFEATLKFMDTELNAALDAHLTDGCGSYKNSITGIHEVSDSMKSR